MRVVLDARWIFPELSGIGLYTRSLIRHLAAIDPATDYVLLFDDPDLLRQVAEATQFDQAANFRSLLLPYGPLGPRNQIQAPGLLRSLQADVYHSPNYLMPMAAFPARRRGRPRCAVTLHDVIPLVFPDHAPRSRKRRLFPVYKALMRRVGRVADAIITVSRSSQRDVIRYLQLPPHQHPKIRVIYNGVADSFRPPPGGAGEAAPGRDRVILFVGRMDPYKNVLTLIEAFARLRAQGANGVRLRIVGARDPRYPEAAARVRALNLDRWVDWVGYVDNQRLVSEYQHADVFALPSRYEGFGLPVLEAMACGTPVICSNTSSLPEVAGEAALLVAPHDIDGWTRAIRTVLTDPAAAATLRERGLRQAAAFSWDRTAEQTLQTYRDLAGSA